MSHYYHLRNCTGIPNNIIQMVVDFCCPSELYDFKITVTPVRKSRCDEYFYGSAYTNKKKVNISLNLPFYHHYFPMFSHYRHKEIRRAGYVKEILLRNQVEVLVYLIAHELRHLWQTNVSKQDFWGRMVFYKTWKNVVNTSFYKEEKDATLYAIKMVKLWRKELDSNQYL
jgi:hypothetical protein